jgi:hypothetical protein
VNKAGNYLSRGKVVGVVAVLVVVIIVSSIIGFNHVLPLFPSPPGPLNSYQGTHGTAPLNPYTVPILNTPETIDWAEISLHKVSLVVNQQFDNNEASWYSHFVGDSTTRILSMLGVEVVDKAPFDATLTINVTGGAVWNDYNLSGKEEDGGITHAPTAAQATISLSLAGENKKSLELEKWYQTIPLSEIVGNYPLYLTPMNEAVAGALIPCLATLWGESVCINAMNDIDELISWAGTYTVYSNCSSGDYTNSPAHYLGGWDAISPNILSALMNAYEHGSKKTSLCAYDTLETVTAGYVYDPLPNLLPILSPEILANSSGINLDSQGNVVSISKEAIPNFIQLLGNNNMLIRVAAAQALSNLGSEAIPALSKAVNDSVIYDTNYNVFSAGLFGNTRIAIAAVYSLKCIGTDAIPALIDATLNPGDYTNKVNSDKSRFAMVSVHDVAVAALTSMGSKTIPAFIQALKNDNPNIRLLAADSLGNLGPAANETVPAIIDALYDTDRTVASHASMALGKITGNQPHSLSDPDMAEYQEWLIAQHLVGKSYLGIYAYDLSFDFGQPSNINATYGIRIPTISETGYHAVMSWGPSHEKLLEGDIIIAFNSTTVRNFVDATSYLEKTAPNDLLIVTVIANNSQINVNVTLGTKPPITQYDPIFL